ncbi:MAG: Gfo/Idh/MocA family oxidoreductase [Dehalococcoidia bacterium]
MSENTSKEIGLAIVGGGTIGRIRAMIAKDHPGVGWIGICDINEEIGQKLTEDSGADFFTGSYEDLMRRPEVNAAIIATDENFHVGPTLAAIEQGHDLFIEKPLATDADESLTVLKAIEASGVDAVVGYTQRFRRRFLATKQKLMTGQIGDVTAVVTRAFMNQMVPVATTRRTDIRKNLTPMVVSGTHALDMCMWLMEGREPVSVYAQSSDKLLGDIGTKDATFGVFTMDDGTIWSMNISWALPVVWPGAVYGLEIGIVGTQGVIDIEDTHRDTVVASENPQGAGYSPDGFKPAFQRHVDFMTSYPPGDMYDGQLWGPMREETNSWYARVGSGMKTHHATASDGHRNLMLTMAMDLSAERGEPVSLPIDPSEFKR